MRVLIPAIASLCIGISGFAEASTATLQLPLDLQFQDLAVEPEAQVQLGAGLSLTTVLVYESASPSDFGPQEILLRRDGEVISLWAGKFNPQFGNAWDQDTAPFASHSASYELTEKFGLGGALAFGNDDDSQLRLAANVFGDSKDPSYTLSAEAQPLPGVTLISAMMHADEEMGLLLGATAEFSVGEHSLAPLLEVARMTDHMIISTGLCLEDGRLRYGVQHSAITGDANRESIVQATASWSL